MIDESIIKVANSTIFHKNCIHLKARYMRVPHSQWLVEISSTEYHIKISFFEKRDLLQQRWTKTYLEKLSRIFKTNCYNWIASKEGVIVCIAVGVKIKGWINQ